MKSQKLVRNGKEREICDLPRAGRNRSAAANDHAGNDGLKPMHRKSGVDNACLLVKIEPNKRENAKRKCPHCKSGDLAFRKGKVRRIRSLNTGRLKTFLEVEVRRIRCKNCGKTHYEKLPFLSTPKSQITRALERQICALRKQMSISAVAAWLDLDWDCVKTAEKRMLSNRYRTTDLSRTKIIGIDEIYVFGKEKSRRKYITVVCDMQTGNVLCVARGKGADALRSFASRLRRQRAKIDCVCMDMSNAYGKWVRENLPEATVVYDHFHLIKAMNDKLNSVRRRTYARISADVRRCIRGLDLERLAKDDLMKAVRKQEERKRKAQSSIKGQRNLLLMNAENLLGNQAAKKRLDRMLAENAEIGKAYVMKERLRSIYAECRAEGEARELFLQWAQEARSAEVGELKSMAAMIEKHLDGILGFWKYPGASNAKVEGFNGKIRWLVKQACGYRDYKYLRLKIFDLPNADLRKSDY